MTQNIKAQIAALTKMSPGQLRDKHVEVFGEPTRSGNRAFLIKRLAWRLQSLAEGGLSDRARQRAAELARDADIRITAPRQPAAPSAGALTRVGTIPAPNAKGLPPPGAVLTRQYQGRLIEVTVLPKGFEWEGNIYHSLSGVANRPGLAIALQAACAGRGALVVYSLSRLARSTTDAIGIAERLSQAGANLVSITERIDTTTGMGRFFFTTIAALAQLERDQISERTTMALAHKRSKGERVGGIPYGYQMAGDQVTLTPDAREHGTMALINRLRGSGLSARQIIAELERRSIPPKRGGRWHVKVVLSLCGRAGAHHA